MAADEIDESKESDGKHRGGWQRECELDKVEHKTNEVGLRIVTLGTRGEVCSEKPTK